MNKLPAELAEPLHILEPWPWREALLIAAGVTLVTWLIWLWWRRPRAVAGAPSLPSDRPVSAFEREVAAIQARTSESLDFRRGCHELADLLRRTLVARHGRVFAFLTAREADKRLTDEPQARLLLETSQVRFARRPPGAGKFVMLSTQAIKNAKRGAS